MTAAEREALIRLIETGWGTNQMYGAVNLSIADDQNALEAYARFFRLVASPGVAAAVTRMLWSSTFVTSCLRSARRPWWSTAESGHPRRGWTRRRPPGTRSQVRRSSRRGLRLCVGDVDRVIDEVEEFLDRKRPRAAGGRSLSTILFTDIVDSTVRAVELGRRPLARVAGSA